MQGELRLAWSNRSRTRLAPTPTNISTNSEPEMLKNGTPASPATARAISVLPVPGGPTSSTPRGIRAPSELNFSGYFRNSTTSWSSVLASSTPATSANVTTVLLPRNIRARLLPKLRAWLLVPWACLIMKKMNPPMIRIGRSPVIRMLIQPLSGAGLAPKIGIGALVSAAAFFMSSRTWLASRPGTTTVYFCPLLSFGVTVRVEPSCSTVATLPAATLSRNLEYWTSVFGVVWLRTVNTTARATTTRASITTPLRKNLEFNRASGDPWRRRAATSRVEYSVGS